MATRHFQAMGWVWRTLGLTGYYYNPNFISFNVDPYYNQSRSNSTFGSVTDASGVSLSSGFSAAAIFRDPSTTPKPITIQGTMGFPELPV